MPDNYLQQYRTFQVFLLVEDTKIKAAAIHFVLWALRLSVLWLAGKRGIAIEGFPGRGFPFYGFNASSASIISITRCVCSTASFFLRVEDSRREPLKVHIFKNS